MSNFNIQLVEFLLENNENNINLLKNKGYYYSEDPINFGSGLESKSCYFMFPLILENGKYGYKLKQDGKGNPVIVGIGGVYDIKELMDNGLVPEEYIEDNFKELGLKIEDIAFLEQK